MITALIVDDEQPAISALRKMLEKHCPTMEVVAEASNIHEAKRLYEKHRPDIIFLDIRMPSGSGFDFIENTALEESRVIFTTAYDNYMIKALRLSALDYLLKPVDKDELVEAIGRFEKLKKRPAKESLHFVKSMQRSNREFDRIAIGNADSIILLKMRDILYFKAERSYTIAYTSEGRQYVSSKNIGEFEELLEEHSFFRVHKSFVINMDHIKKYVRGRGGSVVMSNDAKIEVSRLRKSSFLEKFIG